MMPPGIDSGTFSIQKPRLPMRNALAAPALAAEQPHEDELAHALARRRRRDERAERHHGRGEQHLARVHVLRCASAIALQKYMSVVVSCPKIASAERQQQVAALASSRRSRASMTLPTKRAHAPARERAAAARGTTPAAAARARRTAAWRRAGRFIAADQLAERLPLRDPAGERHEEEDHGEEPDQPEQALDGERGRALDRPAGEPDRLVESPARRGPSCSA